VPPVGVVLNAYNILAGQPECKWEDNIKMDLEEIKCAALGSSAKCLQYSSRET
jgi:hypothetical protein